ncbi:MAG TPA: SMC-Scp complex subunit ScpB [Stellaceae bacterium]|nr:SMC-Scp complex subunit ScpB [Stellaceae bacterium]
MTGEDETAAIDPEEAAEERQRLLRVVEAVVFASAEPVPDEALAERLPEGVALAELMEELQRFYRFRGIHLVRAAGGWVFRTAPDLAGALATERVETRRLSRAQIETLAIIAYHQPVTRAEIEEIRGVSMHKGTLDLLMETGWVQPRGRRETPGRPVTWVTTDAFLRHFGLDTLKDLPNLAELEAAGLLDQRPVETLGETGTDRGEPPEEEL